MRNHLKEIAEKSEIIIKPESKSIQIKVSFELEKEFYDKWNITFSEAWELFSNDYQYSILLEILLFMVKTEKCT